MELEPRFHSAVSIRIASLAGSFALFGLDSMTTPEKTAFLGMTAPSTMVPAASFAWTFVPILVFPLSMLCCRTRGNSRRLGVEGAGRLCWANDTADQNPRIAASTNKPRHEFTAFIE